MIENISTISQRGRPIRNLRTEVFVNSAPDVFNENSANICAIESVELPNTNQRTSFFYSYSRQGFVFNITFL